jgi:HK97 gp10 family phage protein
MSVEFTPDRSGMVALRRAVEDETVPRLTDAIYESSQRYVPVLTGALKRSGTTEYGAGVGRVIYGGGPEDVEHATYQEVGTSKMQAQPYLRPAAYQVYDL